MQCITMLLGLYFQYRKIHFYIQKYIYSENILHCNNGFSKRFIGHLCNIFAFYSHICGTAVSVCKGLEILQQSAGYILYAYTSNLLITME